MTVLLKGLGRVASQQRNPIQTEAAKPAGQTGLSLRGRKQTGERRAIQWRFVLRAYLAILAVGVVVVITISRLPPPLLSVLLVDAARAFGPAPAPTPLPPVIDAPAGDQPGGPVGLQEWVQYRGGDYELAGSGFLLKTADTVVGVTTAHSVTLGQPDHLLEHVAFKISGQAEPLVISDTLYGAPGVPRSTTDLHIDYVLLQLEADAGISPELALEPDPRGHPQPGERVILYSGLGDGQGHPYAIYGTVQTAEKDAIWALMEGAFEPGMMSGSPLLSAHTGQVVGMAIAVTPRRQFWLMGFHPIESIVERITGAAEFPTLVDYRRQ